jgi:hypothetical protein
MVANTQAIECLAHEVGALGGVIRHQSENDRMAQRYRQEPGTLTALAEKDAVLVGQAELDAGRRGWGCDADGQARDRSGIAAITATLREMQTFLL